MSNITDYQDLLPQIEQIPDEEIKPINIPVNVLNQEAENLHAWAMDDKDQLVARGLPVATIKALLPAAGACREAQARWFQARHGKQDAEKDWAVLSPAAYELRDLLVEEFEFAFYGDAGLLARIAEIKAGAGNEDMIQDLNNLAVLGKANTGLLKKTNFDVTLLDKAAELSDKMATLLAAANGDLADKTAVKKIRDQACIYLKKRVDEVRRYGKFVFRDDKDRLVGYLQHYQNRHSR